MGRPSKYPDELRREAVELVRSSGRSMPTSREASASPTRCSAIGCRPTVRREPEPPIPRALDESEREELKRLRKENADLRMDGEILRKAAAFFARKTNR